MKTASEMPETAPDLKQLEHVTLDLVTQRCLDLTNDALNELGRRGSNLKRLTERAFQSYTGNLAKLQRGLVGILKEARAINKEHKDWAEDMSHEEMVEFLLGAISRLPEEYRLRIRGS